MKVTIELTQEQIVSAIKEKYPDAVINTEHSNSGIYNSGAYNSGACNSGDRNSGERNSGDRNSGERNSGIYNSGERNSGACNSGDRNSGDYNSGNHNSGTRNTGTCNSGTRNTGERNSGAYNSGAYNSGDYNPGYFNTGTPDTILVFNKPCLRSLWERAKKPDFLFFGLTAWVTCADMTKDEKARNPNHIATGGYLETLDYKTAFSLACSTATPEEISLLKALPNYDAEVFEEISGYNFGE